VVFSIQSLRRPALPGCQPGELTLRLCQAVGATLLAGELAVEAALALDLSRGEEPGHPEVCPLGGGGSGHNAPVQAHHCSGRTAADTVAARAWAEVPVLMSAHW
jgi:hypothetical protein